MEFFLKIKAWQLFILLFVLPYGLQFAVMGTLIGTGEPALIFVLMPFVMLVFIAVFIGWFWTLGTELNKKVPEEIRMKSGFFRFGIIYSFIYMLCFLVFFVLTTTANSVKGLFAVIVPFHLFAMFCMFYGLYFVSKNFVMAERKQAVRFYDFAGPFFLIWFYPIGVWFIQPRINRMFQKN